ncbi:MAG: Crp/Fnr family transcriptional regulator [Candidatus Lindowbacteria bacterium]|nr:Crp/Fnr family transcriptional regulator [Candidatus Lindowbacteria bacterium]
MFEASDLKEIPILSHLCDSDLVTLGLVLEEKEFAAGATIFSEGSEGNALFIIFAGEVHISKTTHSGEAGAIRRFLALRNGVRADPSARTSDKQGLFYEVSLARRGGRVPHNA